MIETENIEKQYEGKTILDQVSLRVNPGEIFGIIGPSGAGKSTFLRLLDLIEEPTHGLISILGEDVTSDPGTRFQIRQRMAMLFQKPVVFNMTVEKNIGIGLRFRRIGSSELQKRVRDALTDIGLGGYGSRRAVTLSGGEAQRVSLARAMVTDPEILYLDEPTANLDPQSTEMIEQLVLRMHREEGTTVILSTHDMLQGQRLTEKMGVMMGGKLQQVGTIREIFHTPRNRQIAQFVGMENVLHGVVTTQEGGEAAISLYGHQVYAVSNIQIGRKVFACFRAEDVTIDLEPRTLTSARNVFSGTIRTLTPVGPFVDVTIDCGFPITSMVTIRSTEDLGLAPGKQVWITFKATAIHVLPEETES